jgi:tRNA (cytidine56-2'-O)-methyltransferase
MSKEISRRKPKKFRSELAERGRVDFMITVLRLGHRADRDPRVSTHVGLVARAFGAGEIIFSGEKDPKLLGSVRDVAKRWGGPFKASYSESWKKILKSYRKKGYKIAHLTMYGLPLQVTIRKIRKKRNLLVVIGSEKVPHEIYRLADYNIAVTSQPHSEVAALAVFLHEYFRGKELSKKFKAAKLKIVPQEKGKRVVEK